MARKNLFANITASLAPGSAAASPTPPQSDARSDYARRGASRSMMQSLDELAETSMRVLEGDAIVALDPDLIDASFIPDRIGDDGEAEYLALREAIRQVGQSSPVLVRPHAETPGRYMIVYGHRRVRAARDLGLKVRAVVKPLEDIAHVIAQGQENSARADLTFIEKALFARRLLRAGMTRETIKAALTIDDTLLSRMLSVVETIPDRILDAIGAARGVGRDRWESLKKLMAVPARQQAALDWVETAALADLSPVDRFESILAAVKRSRAPVRPRAAERSWSLAEAKVAVATRDTGRAFTLSLKARDASGFGTYLSDQLEDLYQAFRQSTATKPGD